MTHAVRGFGLAVSLVLVSTLAVPSQSSAQSTSAYVYIQVGGPAGAVYGYSANSSGQLAAISGSPFKPGSRLIGGNGAQFFTLGSQNLHSFGVSSNGAIGAQIGQVPVLDYAGGSCGGGTSGQNGAVLDHTGKEIYVMLAPNNCVAYQSYAITSAGYFNFGGDAQEPQSLFGSDLESVSFGLPTILGNETFGYAEFPKDSSGNGKLLGFRRGSSGTLELMQFSETDPGGTPVASAHDPDASPTGNYVVVQVNSSGTSPTYLASYAVDSQGNLSTTNTYSNMPTTKLVPDFNTSNQYARRSNSAFSPDGKFFAVYGGGGTPGSAMNGIEIYNFNGAAPLTLYKTLVPGAPIDDIAWDNSNHLYAISNSANSIYVFTVTSTGVVEDFTGSLASPVSLAVVSQASSGGGGGGCAAPTSDGVNVCSPDENATVSSPVTLNAAATVSGGVYRFEVWNGSTKLLSSDSGTIDQSVTLAAGTYHLTFVARNSSGTKEYAYRDITVNGGGGGGGTCTAPSSDGVNVCMPDENATVSSPVQIDAAATLSGGVYRFELWNGSTKLLSVDNGTMDQTVALAAGSYHLTFVARNSSGTHEYATRDITVSGSGGATTQYQAPLIGNSTAAISGQVSIDTSGNTTLTMTGAGASTSYTLEFCPAFVEGEYSQPSCFALTTASTNSSGSASWTVKFPQSGNWAGEFSLVDGSGKTIAFTDLNPNSTTETFLARLLPDTKTNGGVVTFNDTSTTVQDPLTSGTVSYANGTAVFTVKGAAPNTDYTVSESQTNFLDSSGTYNLNQTLNTDASGNGSLSVNLASEGTTGGDMFQVEYQPQPGDTHNRAGFTGGFVIP